MNPRVMKYTAKVGFDAGQFTWFDLSDLPPSYEEELMEYAKEIGWFEKKFKLDEFFLPSNDLAIIFEHPSNSQQFVFTFNKLTKINFETFDHTYEGPVICAYLYSTPDPMPVALICNDINTGTGDYLHLRSDLRKSFQREDFSRMYEIMKQEMTSPFVVLSLLNRKALVSEGTLTTYKGEEKSSFINKKRRAKNKPPIYSWTTVELKPSAPRKEHQGGTHASPARHERRGHFRKYPSGKIGWVRPAWVGSIERGMTVHDYLPSKEIIPSQEHPGAA